MPNGSGIETLTKETYEGRFKNGKREGYGKITYHDKSYYRGNFINGKKEG